jgi:hypothetical protein
MEEKEILLNIYNRGRPVALGRENGNLSITIAPVPEDRKER